MNVNCQKPRSEVRAIRMRHFHFPVLSMICPARLQQWRPNIPSNRRLFRGFTLLELLVVLVILGLLASYVGPKYFAQIGKSETKVARAQLDALSKALDQYRLDVGHYPTTAQGLATLVARPGGEAGWAGPYLTKGVPNDPWNRAYLYVSPGQHGEYDLSTLGKDGRPGGDGADTDVTNW